MLASADLCAQAGKADRWATTLPLRVCAQEKLHTMSSACAHVRTAESMARAILRQHTRALPHARADASVLVLLHGLLCGKHARSARAKARAARANAHGSACTR
eukprot:2299482-Pleurochrysis_carterae.AAC.2